VSTGAGQGLAGADETHGLLRAHLLSDNEHDAQAFMADWMTLKDTADAAGLGLLAANGAVGIALGPRWLRLHTGGGYRSDVSTGASIFTWYRPLRRERRRRS
jgi:hypothetical protein